MGCNSGGVSADISICIGKYVWIMLFGRVLARESPLDLDGSIGLRGDCGCESLGGCELVTSIFIGRFGGCQLSGVGVVDGESLFERFLFAVRSGEAVLERGCPHWDMKESTVGDGSDDCKGQAGR